MLWYYYDSNCIVTLYEAAGHRAVQLRRTNLLQRWLIFRYVYMYFAFLPFFVAVGPQPYYVQSPSSYQMSQQIRLPGIQRVGSQSPMVSNSPTQPLTSHSAVVNDDTPVTTRRFNAYKENRDLGGQSMLNTSSATLRPHMSSASVQSALPADFGHMVCLPISVYTHRT